MNKFKLITLSILGGVDTALYISTPIMLTGLYFSLQEITLLSYIILSAGFLSSIFRAIKIGWFK